MNTLKKFSASLAFNIIGAIVFLLAVFSVIVSSIGYASFTNAFKNEYRITTENMANTATTLVNGDRIDDYLAEGGTSEDFIQSQKYLDTYCDKMNVSIVYVIKVDTSDYRHFTSVFNSVDNTVDNTEYTPWEIGFERETTNDEYASKYKQIYETGEPSEPVYRTKDLGDLHAHITTLVPVKSSSGEVVSLLCIQRPMSELNEGRRPYLITVAISAVILSIISAIFAALLIRKNFVTPIRKVINEAHRFAEENAQGEKLSGNKYTIEEIADLAKSIDIMEEKMMNYIENLTAVMAEKERIGAELSVASTIQENSIPNIFPAFPERKEFDIFASMTPAKEVGGDFYNFFLIDDDHLAIVIGDVSGKGIPAALFMMVTNILITDRTHMGGTPAEILTFVNKSICEHNRADMFVTLWLGILEISTGKVAACNAGHDDAMIYRKGGEFEMLTSRHGIVVGAMSEAKYRDFEIQLNKGDKLFLYTDGVPEATDKNNKMFTIKNTLQALNKYKEKSPEEILEGVKSSVNDFVGDAPQFDDLTVLCIELKETDDMNKLVIDATCDNLSQVIDFVDEFLEKNDCPMKVQMQFDLSVEEIFTNIANYAYGDETGKAEICVSAQDGVASVEFKDSGVAYNPLEKADPDITLSAEERQIGGLGIFLVKKNMDEVLYSYENGQNVLTLKKKI